MQTLSNEMKNKIKEYNNNFKGTNVGAKIFIGHRINQGSLDVYRFIPKHGCLDFDSEGAKYGLRYYLGLAALLNVDKLSISVPAEIAYNDSANIFHRHGFKSNCVSTSSDRYPISEIRSSISTVEHNTTFTYEIPKPSSLFQKFLNTYYALMDYLEKKEEEHEIKFYISECNHTSGLPVYEIAFDYLNGTYKGKFSLKRDTKGFFLQRGNLNDKVYLGEPELMNAKVDDFTQELLLDLWTSMMKNK
ncbi:hypothetical protein U8V72_22085 [Priestia filamentosa]|uniref:hypothetical protein n=1 Tax=Priestia filamentosa TaxID=1402861 RepID=UPI0039791C57